MNEQQFAPILPIDATLYASGPDRFWAMTRADWAPVAAMPGADPPPPRTSRPYADHPLTVARLRREMSLRQVGRHCGVTDAAVWHWVARGVVPSAAAIRTMATLFGETPATIRQWFAPEA